MRMVNSGLKGLNTYNELRYNQLNISFSRFCVLLPRSTTSSWSNIVQMLCTNVLCLLGNTCIIGRNVKGIPAARTHDGYTDKGVSEHIISLTGWTVGRILVSTYYIFSKMYLLILQVNNYCILVLHLCMRHYSVTITDPEFFQHLHVPLVEVVAVTCDVTSVTCPNITLFVTKTIPNTLSSS